MSKALIADDHALVRNGLRELLESCAPELSVIQVENLPQALDVLGRDPEVALVLLDLVLPGAEGLEGLELLRKHYPSVAVVVVSADETPSVMRRAIAAGAAGYLPKSTRMEVLAGALRLILSGGVYVPPGALEAEAAEPAVPPLPNPAALGLTARRGEILRLLGEGCSNRTIGRRLNLAEQTVKNQVSQTLRRLGVSSRVEAAVLARRYRQPDAGA